jgi:hypothetical protein
MPFAAGREAGSVVRFQELMSVDQKTTSVTLIGSNSLAPSFEFENDKAARHDQSL